MPNCFQLSRPGVGPVALQTIDEEMCKHFEVPCDPVRWYREWYNIIGLGLACGKSFEQLRNILPQHLDIIDWLDSQFTADAWVEVGRTR